MTEASTRQNQPAAVSAAPAAPTRPRPLSPNIQLYRPQLTSVLSITNRITGMLLSVGTIWLVVWLAAAASGPGIYAGVRDVLLSWPGQLAMVVFTFSFFFHLCGSLRHLMWDTVHGFELRAIYISGWVVVFASVLLTALAWVVSLLVVT